jgi:hypothetical protein
MMIVRLRVPLHQAKRKSFAVPLRRLSALYHATESCQRLCTTPCIDNTKLRFFLNFQIFLKIIEIKNRLNTSDGLLYENEISS